MSAKIINIEPKCKRHRYFLFCLGAGLLIVSSLLNVILWEQYKIQLIFFMSVCLMVLFVAFVKFLEPPISYSITPQSLHYQHRYGEWTLPWQDVVRIGDININVQGGRQQLPYIGIKLNSLVNIAENISPRLANRLLHEQQELLLLAVKNGQLNLPHGAINFDLFELQNVIYKGPIAAWLYRCEDLVSAYGYHLYLPENSFDRELNDFLELLKQCHDYTKMHDGNE